VVLWHELLFRRRERDEEPDEDDDLRREPLFSLSSSSSSSPVRASLMPERAPLVFDSAPPEVIDSISSGSPCESSA